MTKGTGPGAQGRSQFPPSRRQTPTPLLTLAHRAPLPVFPAGRLVLVSFLTVHSQNGLIAGAFFDHADDQGHLVWRVLMLTL
jgi:hypothetical protein